MNEMQWSINRLSIAASTLVNPNAIPFKGVLTKLDEKSDHAPHGTGGKLIILPSAVAQAHLDSLIGMGVNVSYFFDEHAPREKIGVIQKASVEGSDLVVEGILYGKDFPYEVEEIKRLSSLGMLGMSFEVTSVSVEDENADVWVISSLVFTGAAILFKDAAAYTSTSLAASKKGKEGDITMSDAVSLGAKLDGMLNEIRAGSEKKEMDTKLSDMDRRISSMEANINKLCNTIEAAASKKDTPSDDASWALLASFLSDEKKEAQSPTEKLLSLIAGKEEKKDPLQTKIEALEKKIALMASGDDEEAEEDEKEIKSGTSDKMPKRKTKPSAPVYAGKEDDEKDEDDIFSGIDKKLAGLDRQSRIAAKLNLMTREARKVSQL